MSDATESARRWRGLVCPACRFVFRVPTDHGGSGLVCPSCRLLLRIPGLEDQSPPLLVRPEEVEEKYEVDVLKGERRRRKKRKKFTEDTPWEEGVRQQRTGRPRSMRMGWQLAAGMVLLVGLVTWLSVIMKRQLEIVLPPAVPDMVEVEEPKKSPEEPVLWYDKYEVEELCRVFLASSSVEEMLPLVRDVERLEPEIRRWHPDGKKESMELTGQGIIRQRTVGKWRVLTMFVQTDTFLCRFINVCETEDGLRVDWESWVGHSSMPWGEMVEKKPTEPVLVRVLLSHVEYYNMDFSDDQKWSSCRILSPDGEHLLYGYVGRWSDEHERLFRMVSADPVGENRVSLMVRYPEGARVSNQVIVDRVVADTWLFSETKP